VFSLLLRRDPERLDEHQAEDRELETGGAHHRQGTGHVGRRERRAELLPDPGQ
jgi:hypothetical protein